MATTNVKRKINFYLRQKSQFFVKRANFFFLNFPFYRGGFTVDDKLVEGVKGGSKNLTSLSASRSNKKNLYYTGKLNFSRFFLSTSTGFFKKFFFLNNANTGERLSDLKVFSSKIKINKLDSFLHWSNLVKLRDYVSFSPAVNFNNNVSSFFSGQSAPRFISNHSFKKFNMRYLFFKYNFKFFSSKEFAFLKFFIGFFYFFFKFFLLAITFSFTALFCLIFFFFFVDGNFADLNFLYDTFYYLIESDVIDSNTYIAILDYFWIFEKNSLFSFYWIEFYNVAGFILYLDFFNEPLMPKFYNKYLYLIPNFLSTFLKDLTHVFFLLFNFFDGFIGSWLFFREHYFNDPVVLYCIAFLFFLVLFFVLIFFVRRIFSWLLGFSDFWKLAICWLYGEDNNKRIWKPEAAAHLFKDDLLRYLKFQRSFSLLVPYNVQQVYTNFLLYKVYGGYGGYLNLFPSYDDFFSYSTAKVNNLTTRNFRALLGIRKNSINNLEVFGKKFFTGREVKWVYYSGWDILVSGFRDFLLKFSNKKNKQDLTHINLDNSVKSNIFTRARFFFGRMAGRWLRFFDYFGLSNWSVQMSPVTKYRSTVLRRVFEDPGLVDEWAAFDLYEKRRDAASRYSKEANFIILSKTLGLTNLRPASFWKFKIGSYPFVNRYTFWRLESNYLGEVDHVQPTPYVKGEERDDSIFDFSKKSFFGVAPEDSEIFGENMDDDGNFAGEEEIFFEDGLLHYDMFLAEEEMEEDDDEELADPEAAHDTDAIELGTLQLDVGDTRNESFDDLYYLWLASPGFIRGAGPEDDFRDVEEHSPEFFFRLARWHKLKTNYDRASRENLLDENPYLAVDDDHREGVEFSSLVNTMENHMDSVYDDLVDFFWLNSSNPLYWNFFDYPAFRFSNNFKRTSTYLTTLRNSIVRRSRYRFGRKRRRRFYARKRYAGRFSYYFAPFFSEFLIPQYNLFFAGLLTFFLSFVLLSTLGGAFSLLLLLYYLDYSVFASFSISFLVFLVSISFVIGLIISNFSQRYRYELMFTSVFGFSFFSNISIFFIFLIFKAFFFYMFKIEKHLISFCKPEIKLEKVNTNFEFSFKNFLKFYPLSSSYPTAFFIDSGSNFYSSSFLLKHQQFSEVHYDRLFYLNGLKFALIYPHRFLKLSGVFYNYKYKYLRNERSAFSGISVFSTAFQSFRDILIFQLLKNETNSRKFFRNSLVENELLTSFSWVFKDLSHYSNFAQLNAVFESNHTLSKIFETPNYVFGRFIFSDVRRISYKATSVEFYNYKQRFLFSDERLRRSNERGGALIYKNLNNQIAKINYSNVDWLTNKLTFDSRVLGRTFENAKLNLEDNVVMSKLKPNLEVSEKTPWYLDFSSYNYSTPVARGYRNFDSWASGFYEFDQMNLNRSRSLVNNHIFRLFFSNVNLAEVYNRKTSSTRLFKPENLFYTLFWGDGAFNSYSTTFNSNSSKNFGESLKRKNKI